MKNYLTIAAAGTFLLVALQAPADTNSVGGVSNAPAAQATAGQTAPSNTFDFQTADGKCTITMNAEQAPELKDWAQSKLAPVLAEWYPKIVAMLPSSNYTAPTHFKITIKPMDGVAYTAGRNVTVSSAWLKSEIHGESIGSVVHELVHVVQRFDFGNNPGWLVEGTADYIRWFKYEPQSHGADIVWMRRLRHFTPHYDGSYRITADFLNWTTEKYDKNIVAQLNAAMREDRYDDALWKEYTGKTVSELGDEWQKEIEAQLANKDVPKAN